MLSQEYCGRFVLSQEYSVFFRFFWGFFSFSEVRAKPRVLWCCIWAVCAQPRVLWFPFFSFFPGVAFFWGGWCVLGQEYPAGGLCEAKSTPQRLVLSQEYSVIFVISVIFVTLVGVAFFLISRR